MILETKRLRLRPWQESDLETLYQLCIDPEVGPRCGWKPHKDLEESRYVLCRLLMNDYTWALEDKESGAVLGDISLMKLDDPAERELGFWLGRPYWGRGYMPEAAQALLDYGFEELGLARIWCRHNRDNAQSARVQEKCGFVFHSEEAEHPLPQLGISVPSVLNCLDRQQWEKEKSRRG